MATLLAQTSCRDSEKSAPEKRAQGALAGCIECANALHLDRSPQEGVRSKTGLRQSIDERHTVTQKHARLHLLSMFIGL